MRAPPPAMAAAASASSICANPSSATASSPVSLSPLLGVRLDTPPLSAAFFFPILTSSRLVRAARGEMSPQFIFADL